MILIRFSRLVLLVWSLFALVSCNSESSSSGLITLPDPDDTVSIATVEEASLPNDLASEEVAAEEGSAGVATSDSIAIAEESVLDDAAAVAESVTGGNDIVPPANELTTVELANTNDAEPSGSEPLQRPETTSKLIDPESWNYAEVYEKPGYELVFSDEFNSRDINTDRWNTQLRWDGEFNGQWYEYRVINGEKQFYVNVLTRDGEHRDKLLQPSGFTPFRFDGAQLAIRATTNPFLGSRQPTNINDSGRDISFGRFEPLLKRAPFLSGAIASYDKFSQKYGYFEARIRLPAHIGTFPAFWLHHQRQESQDTQRTEIDIMENLGHTPGVIYNAFHYFNFVTEFNPGEPNSIKPQPSGRITAGGNNFSDNYHVYAVDWQPGSIVWYLDGQPVSWLSSPQVDFEEKYVILNLAIGGDWVNFPVTAGGLGRGETDFYPTIAEQDPLVFGNPEMEIDYVRVFKRISD